MNSYPKKSLTPLEIRRRRRLTVTSGKLSLTGLTLIELLIAIGLLSVIILAISNMDLFTRFHTISADRRVKLQNDASFILEHMAKEINKAIGDTNNSAVDTSSTIEGNTAVQVWIDYNQNGRRDAGDREIAYRFTGSPTAYQIKWCPECANGPCTNCNPNWNSTEILSSRINSFTPTFSSGNNFVDIQLTACWDPDEVSYACGTPDNPEVVMRTKIKMPSVSTH